MLLEIISSALSHNKEISFSVLDQLVEQLIDKTLVLGQRIILAAIIYFIGRWLITWIRRFFNRFLERKKIERTVCTFLDNVANITLKIILFLLIVNILGISTTSFAAILAAVGLAVGMAMKDNLSNFAGGVMLLINKPFRVGNRILAQGVDGTVQSIGILYTILTTGDNRTIFIPNGPLSTGNIINYSNQPVRRIDITLSLNFGADINDIKEILNDIIKSEVRVQDYPSVPFIGVTNINNATIDITIRVWVNTSEYSSVSTYLNEEIYAKFSQKGLFSQTILSVKMLKE